MCVSQITYFILNELGHHITGVNVDRANGHDFLAVVGSQGADQMIDERIELLHLLLVVVL